MDSQRKFESDMNGNINYDQENINDDQEAINTIPLKNQKLTRF
jgi:hypothetical protein